MVVTCVSPRGGTVESHSRVGNSPITVERLPARVSFERSRLPSHAPAERFLASPWSAAISRSHSRHGGAITSMLPRWEDDPASRPIHGGLLVGVRHH
jgi:hypothetical protein